MLRLAFDFIITWRETRTRPNAYNFSLKLSYVIGMENDIQTSAVSRIYFSNFIFNIQTFA
mgnify:CR=1 FL=1